MRITKYEHACVVLEEKGKKLVIDPGNLTPTFGDLSNIVAVVVTHEHEDHLNLANLQKILDNNPDVQIFAPAETAEKMTDFLVTMIQDGQTISVESFQIKFFGGPHAIIIPDEPLVQNTGLLVNQKFYYPGGSFVLPDEPVEVLAAPIDGVWLKLAETIDFVRTIKPKICIPTHDAELSEDGKKSVDTLMAQICQTLGTEYKRLQTGSYLDI